MGKATSNWNVFDACMHHGPLEQTETPFVTKIYDAASNKAAFFEGRLLLAGDTLTAFRPYIALSINQAAYNYELLEQVVERKMTLKKWDKAVLKYGHAKRMLSIVVGVLPKDTKLALLWNVCKFILLIVCQRLGLLS